MTFNIPIKKLKEKETFKTDEIRMSYEELDAQAYLDYGSKFSDLSKKEQKEIALKVIRGV